MLWRRPIAMRGSVWALTIWYNLKLLQGFIDKLTVFFPVLQRLYGEDIMVTYILL